MPKNFSQIVAHLRPISDSEVRRWIICNTYSPVLESRRSDALRDFRAFCISLGWDAKEIKEEMELTEELLRIKPIDNGLGTGSVSNPSSGCLSVIAILFIMAILCSFVII